MMAAFEAALSAQSSKYTTVSQQLRLELKEALVKANQVGRDVAGLQCSAIRLSVAGMARSGLLEWARSPLHCHSLCCHTPGPL